MKSFNRPVLVMLCSVAFFSSCSTARKGVSELQRPTPEKLQSILDSICSEGYNLYCAERANWIASDSAVYNIGFDRIGGTARWQTSNNTWHISFFDTTLQYCLMEALFEPAGEKLTCSYPQRSISEAEKDIMNLQNRMFQNAIAKYGDSIQIANRDFGNPNFDFIKIDDQTMRMYMLQGTNKNNVIPFGLDYSFDFDFNGNVTAFRRYHQSLIPIATKTDDGSTQTAIHSHLKNNPYITPTDICNFLLYRTPDMKQTWVLSTALNGYIIYDAPSNSAVFVSIEAMNKIRQNE